MSWRRIIVPTKCKCKATDLGNYHTDEYSSSLLLGSCQEYKIIWQPTAYSFISLFCVSLLSPSSISLSLSPSSISLSLSPPLLLFILHRGSLTLLFLLKLCWHWLAWISLFSRSQSCLLHLSLQCSPKSSPSIQTTRFLYIKWWLQSAKVRPGFASLSVGPPLKGN